MSEAHRVNDDLLLFAAAMEHPDEDTPRLALADWFDEHDEPDFASALRASKEMIAFLGGLRRWDTSPAHAVTSYENGTARDHFPTPAAARLLLRYGEFFPTPPGAPTEYREDAPTPRSPDAPLDPRAFLYRWQHARSKHIAAMRQHASRIAAKPSLDPDIFQPPALDPGEFEGRSCLLQELVLRRRDLPAIPGVIEHAAVMRERKHPLAWLPLSLLPPDAEISRAYAPVTGEPLPIRSLDGVETPAVATSEPHRPNSHIFAAVRGWRDESNGLLEGIEFRLDRAVASDVCGRLWFSRLPADSLNAALVSANWSVNRVPPGWAFSALYQAAYNGGAYGGQKYGAYARLHAWQSLGALAGCGEDADAAAIASTVPRCEWYTFFGTNWFMYIAWDLGLICVRPDRRTVALLAATDTD